MNEAQWWESPQSSEIGRCLEFIGCFLEFIPMAIARLQDTANALTRKLWFEFSYFMKEKKSLKVKACWKQNQVDICHSCASLLSQNTFDPGNISLYSKTSFSLVYKARFSVAGEIYSSTLWFENCDTVKKEQGFEWMHQTFIWWGVE